MLTKAREIGTSYRKYAGYISLEHYARVNSINKEMYKMKGFCEFQSPHTRGNPLLLGKLSVSHHAGLLVHLLTTLTDWALNPL